VIRQQAFPTKETYPLALQIMNHSLYGQVAWSLR
jgi:hypothetical protein